MPNTTSAIPPDVRVLLAMIWPLLSETQLLHLQEQWQAYVAESSRKAQVE